LLWVLLKLPPLEVGVVVGGAVLHLFCSLALLLLAVGTDVSPFCISVIAIVLINPLLKVVARLPKCLHPSK